MTKIETGYLLKYNLQFFASEGSGGEKTEEATSKKLNDARGEGQVAKSTDLITASMLITLFIMIKLFVGYIGNGFLGSFREIYGSIEGATNNEFSRNTLLVLVSYCIKEIAFLCFPMLISAFVIAFITNIIQVKWQISFKPLQPKFSKFNPISGMKRLFSKDKLFELLKDTAKIGVIAYIVYDVLKDKWNMIIDLYRMPLVQAIMWIGNLVIDLGLRISIIFLALAFADFIYQRLKFKKDMRMSKQEVKDEYKNSEGDPHIKGQIKSKMREISQRRMMQALPQADVVITNPTHLAVAIKYDRESSEAPVVIAKGADYLAEKIKSIARDNQIEVVENKPLARMLYYNVDIDAQIPPELYQMVAEILAYVYGLKGKI